MASHLHVCIPAIDELQTLPMTLDALEAQNCTYPFSIHICVNQPDEWWQIPEKRAICEANQTLLRLLQQRAKNNWTLIDRTTPGNGWQKGNDGVGMARKTLFDNVLNTAQDNDVVVSLDADTLFKPQYLQSIGDLFSQAQKLNAVSIPYYHKLSPDDAASRAILRYELYMRSFLINLFLIESPFAFTAIGSAIAVKVKALKKIGSITPMKSGEDFYLLQKLRKMDFVGNWNTEMVYPAARFSSRVFFGTGPAMIKGNEGNWESYPIYQHTLFQDIKKSYDSIPELFIRDVELPISPFLAQQFKRDNVFAPLRKNSKTEAQFAHAFHEKFDGLRLLQYLKLKQKELAYDDTESLRENFLHFFGEIPPCLKNISSLESLTTSELDSLRNLLFDYEMHLREKQHHLFFAGKCTAFVASSCSVSDYL